MKNKTKQTKQIKNASYKLLKKKPDSKKDKWFSFTTNSSSLWDGIEADLSEMLPNLGAF